MNRDLYASFLQSMGHRVVRTADGDWFDVARGIYSSFPFHQPLPATQVDPRRLLGWSDLALRYACPADEGRKSYQYVCAGPGYDIAELSPNTRSKVRRGLRRCHVERVGFPELIHLGALDVSRDTYRRQGRGVPSDHDSYWMRYFCEADRAGCFESWVAMVDGKLGAFLIACQIEECANLFVLRSHQDLLPQYPNNGLLFTYLQETLAREDISLVSYGWESIQPELDSLDKFKSSMGFAKQSMGQRIEWNPWLRIVLNRPVATVVGQLAGQRRGAAWQKMAGMLRWYHEQPRRAA